MSKVKTVGLGRCTGCTDDATIRLNQVEVVSQPEAVYSTILTTPDNGVCVRTNSPPNAGACSALPALNRTWGSLKATYR